MHRPLTHRTLTKEDFERLLRERVVISDLLGDLRPPKHFARAKFANYRTDPGFPSQENAVRALKAALHDVNRLPGLFSKIFRSHRERGIGVYLDGGFGVGKTHLLAACYHASHSKRSFLSFQELMFLVGLQGLQSTVVTFEGHSLLLIDEFELDDPANTRITTNLLGQLLERGVSIITTSNTPPGALGEGKFSVEAFRTEMAGLFDSFSVLRIEGEDFRAAQHDHAHHFAGWKIYPEILDATEAGSLRIPFQELLNILGSAHPIRIRKSLTSLRSIVLLDVKPVSDPFQALRMVYFIDKVYDDDITLSAQAAVSHQDLFAPEVFKGGDTKKYLRTISRLSELTS